MPRAREFDPRDALEDAMTVFWDRGYTATSIGDLVEATGVNRYGLYDVYGSKHGVFIRSLEHYLDTVISESIREVELAGAGRAAIVATFDRLLDRARAGDAKAGCLLCNTAEEMAPHDEDSRRVVAAFQARLGAAFARAVATGQEAGKIESRSDPDTLGRYLAGLIQGVSYLARSGAAIRELEDFVHVGLRVLD